MPLSISTTSSQATVVFMQQALFGQAASNAVYTVGVTEASASASGYAISLGSNFSGTADSALSTLVLKNLGVTSTTIASATYTALEAALTSAFAANPTARGAVVLNVAKLLSGLEGNAIYGTVATTFNTTVVSNLTYSSTSTNTAALAVVPGTVAAVAAQTFTLTTGSNTFTGSTGDDTFDAGLSTSSLQTLNSGDQLDGGAGTDSLIAVLTASVTPTKLANIETVSFTNTGAASVIDLSNATGVTSLISQGSTGTTLMQGMSTATNVYIQDTSIAHTVTFNNVTGSADSATLYLKNVTSSPIITAAGVETVTLNSTGSVLNVISAPAFAAATSLNVTGVIGINLGSLATSSTSIKTLNASALVPTDSIGVTVTMGSTNATTVTGSSGNDTITMGASANADSVSGGAGVDTITFSANLTAADTIDGGDGTDILRGTSADLVATGTSTTPTTYTVTNVETIQSSDALNGIVYPMNISATAARFDIRSTTAAVYTGSNDTIVGGAGTFTIVLGTSSATGITNASAATGGLTVTDTGSATTDSLTITNSAVDTPTGPSVAKKPSMVAMLGRIMPAPLLMPVMVTV